MFDGKLPQHEADLVILRTARALITNKKDWCTYNLVDNEGRRCARGAYLGAMGGTLAEVHWFEAAQDHSDVRRIDGYLSDAAEEMLRAKGWPECPLSNRVVRVNNRFGHAATLEMYDRAIAALEAKIKSTVAA